MPYRPVPRARALVTQSLQDAGKRSLFFDRRRRGHLALLCAVLGVSIFGFLLLQPRKVRVQADGRDLTISTHASSDAAVLRGTGVWVRDGDRVTLLEGEGADVLRVERARAVMLIVDGETYRMRSHASLVGQLLDEAGATLMDRDSILLNGAVVPANAPIDAPVRHDAEAGADAEVVVEVRRAVPFTVSQDGNEMTTTTSRPTVAQALHEAGIIVGPGDAVTPAPDAALAAGDVVSIRHAKAVTVTLPDDHRVLYTLAATVGDVLVESGIAIPSGAYIDPPADTQVTAGLSVRLVQLSAGNDEEREFIESKTVYRTDPSLAPGETRTVRGHDGARVRRYDVSYVNGEEAGRTLVDDYYDPEPEDTVVYYPPQRTDAAPEAPSGDATVSKTLHVYASAYNAASAGRSPNDPGYGITASGARVTYGIVAVDPSVIPLGTKMFIPGYGYAVAGDTGGAVKGYIIDLGFPDGVSIDWTPKWVDIQILS